MRGIEKLTGGKTMKNFDVTIKKGSPQVDDDLI